MQWFDFYKGKKVLVTGHTGFKGSWMVKLLLQAGAEVTGYALKPPTEPGLFELCGLSSEMNSIEGDIRDLAHLKEVFSEVKPEIVIHMAAQPIVRESYRSPVYTYETNVMGTVNVLESVRLTDTVRSVVNVTTDKVYRNKEWCWGYREDEELNGFDPYSNSKSCSELVTSAYRSAFLQEKKVAVSTVRAGNVIGGGDFAADRIIPDCIRAVEAGKDIIVRNPYSVRPYEHVLEPVAAYLMIAAAQYEDNGLAGSYNVGPEEADSLTTGELVDLFCRTWKKETGFEPGWIDKYDGGPHEANFLKLDCSKLKSTFGWKPVWNIEKTMEKLVEWYHIYLSCGKINECMERQIGEFLNF
ncbi:MAG: CDP-glucose 4,6-dehydratase [Suilimivivens sp.]